MKFHRLSALTLLLLLSACATQPPSNESWLSLGWGDSIASNSRGLGLREITTLDGEPIDDFRLISGQHTITIEVSWANGFKDETTLTGFLAGGHRYTIYVYQLPEGKEEHWADVHHKSITREMGEAFTEGMAEGAAPFVIIITSPVWIPYMIWKSTHNDKEPPGMIRPPGTFVWIEENKTGLLIAGSRPSGVTLLRKSEAAHLK
jgi:hypothetical protein